MRKSVKLQGKCWCLSADAAFEALNYLLITQSTTRQACKPSNYDVLSNSSHLALHIGTSFHRGRWCCVNTQREGELVPTEK